MQFTFEIPDALLPSMELYLAANVNTQRDPLTGSTVVTRNPGHESIDALLRMTLSDLVNQIATRYPTGEIRAKLEAIKAIQEEAKALATVTTANGGV